MFICKLIGHKYVKFLELKDIAKTPNEGFRETYYVNTVFICSKCGYSFNHQTTVNNRVNL